MMGRPRIYGEVCVVEGCKRTHFAHGLCHTHYKYKRRKDNPKEIATRDRNIKTYHQRYKTKKRARNLVYLAIKEKRLTKGICEICKSTKVEGHHNDYTKALEVIWLCNKHHRELHKSN